MPESQRELPGHCEHHLRQRCEDRPRRPPIHLTSYDHEGDIYREEDYAPFLDTESDQEWCERMYSEIEEEALLAWENVQELLFL